MKKVLILGDFHGHFKLAYQHYLNVLQFFNGLEIDLLVQVGDKGFFPRDRKAEVWDYELDHDAHFIDGNHDDHLTIKNFDEPGFGLDPEKYPNLPKWERSVKDIWEYKPRGSIEDGVLYIGGARSVNPSPALKDKDWYPGENITYIQQRDTFRRIEEYGPKNIHTVISHDCPGSFNVEAACSHSGVEMIDGNRKFLESIKTYVRPQRWYFGHYHLSMSGVKDGVYWRCVDMIRGEGKDDFVLVDFPET